MDDVDILNYVLTIEHLQATFNQEGLDDFSADYFMNVDLGCDVCDKVNGQIRIRLKSLGSTK